VIRPYRYRPAWFFVMAYAGSWLPWFLGLYLGSQPELARYAPLFNFIGLFGPIGASSVLVLTSGHAALQSDFKDRLLDLRRIRPLLALLAVVMPSPSSASPFTCPCGSDSRAISSGLSMGPRSSR
jgi:hypothetical protein